jgi:hypothetical protein
MYKYNMNEFYKQNAEWGKLDVKMYLVYNSI